MTYSLPPPTTGARRAQQTDADTATQRFAPTELQSDSNHQSEVAPDIVGVAEPMPKLYAMSRRDRLERHNVDLIDALTAMTDSVSQELADRMRRCREDRIRRRETPIVTFVDAVRRGPQFKCKAISCWCCRTAHIRRKRIQAMSIFASSTNAHCSLVTVNAHVSCDDLNEVAIAHTKFAVDLDNLRDGAATRDRRFGHMAFFAVLEVAHDGNQWRPHWHVLLSHPRIDRQEITAVFQRRFPGSRRVQVEPFHTENTVAVNVEKCVGYMLKFDLSQWLTSTSMQFLLWLRRRAALRSISVIRRPKLKPARISSPMHQVTDRERLANSSSAMNPGELDEIKPMPIII